MHWHRACAASLLVAAHILCGSAAAQSDPDAAFFKALEASWCTAPHDDYRSGDPVVEIRQFRDLMVIEDEKTHKPHAVAVRMRSAMVSAQTKRLEYVGAWVDYRFEVKNRTQLKDASVGLALSIALDRQQIAYKYGDSKMYSHRRCGAADVELVAKSLLPAEIPLSVVLTASGAAAETRTEVANAASAANPPPRHGAVGVARRFLRIYQQMHDADELHLLHTECHDCERPPDAMPEQGRRPDWRGERISASRRDCVFESPGQ